MKEDNQIVKDTKAFAVRIVKLYQYLTRNKTEFVMSNQILRSGTRIGSNIYEAVFAYSKKDFVNKLTVSLKEANETKFWLELLHETDYINDNEFDSIYNDCSKIVGTLVNIVKTSKNSDQ